MACKQSLKSKGSQLIGLVQYSIERILCYVEMYHVISRDVLLVSWHARLVVWLPSVHPFRLSP